MDLFLLIWVPCGLLALILQYIFIVPKTDRKRVDLFITLLIIDILLGGLKLWATAENMNKGKE